jgi:hypothetical protein
MQGPWRAIEDVELAILTWGALVEHGRLPAPDQQGGAINQPLAPMSGQITQ